MIKIRNYFPEFLKKVLWGNRSHWGLEIDDSAPCWIKWEDEKLKFYQQNQRKGIGAVVNDAGYEVMSGIDLEGKRVLEIGAGDIRHHKFWDGAPKEYILADVHDGMMEQAKAKLDSLGIPYRAIEVERNAPLDFEPSSIDLILSFYSLEHLNPLAENLLEMKRLLKPGGLLIGATIKYASAISKNFASACAIVLTAALSREARLSATFRSGILAVVASMVMFQACPPKKLSESSVTTK